MASRKSHLAFREKAEKVLAMRGYMPIPAEGLRHLGIVVDLAGLANSGMICAVFRIRSSGVVNEETTESAFAYEICQLRDLLLRQPIDVPCAWEIWVRSPNRYVHCYAVLPDRLSEAGAYALR